ncbi:MULTISPECIES: LysR substrate-binding domain-containing protein [Bradyrhizobium]|uniref:LysR substrate-binding domain-containing protein n=1 Tax=Bradyrhizobium TaxID=374 RepID=UPI00055B9E1A|nr:MULTISPECIES: LysR substrate-binding domain-containing protein [Bradyrhizobium]MCA1381779.1 LysR family transcriptional regulator [Bradyrhizobium sp. BRP05]MCA1417344.1 LysR family transcriptional regulator [Bradyrhizobium sp. BRP23]
MLSSIPISSIRAFEAAARTGSFRDAANELHLTPSAVSHAIRKLESAMGTILFERSARAIRLTPAGANLMRHAGAAFDNLRRGIEEVAGRGPQLLRVHCAPSFAAQWLAPRLARFMAAEPKLEVRLAANTEYARFSNDDFDIDIVYGKPRAEGVEIIPLGEETVTPLCTPELAKKIRKPKDLFDQVLIRSEVKQVQWHQWFSANGLEAPAIHGMRFDRSFLAIAMASSGLGVTLESTLLAEREIATRRLVAPLARRSVDIRYVGHHLVFPRAGQQRRPIRVFAEWITRELAAGRSA